MGDPTSAPASAVTPELDVARRAALAGAEVLTRAFREGVVMREKGASNLVSDADVESEHVIAAVIRDALPGHAIWGEESNTHDRQAEHLWIVDPLDGTTNFAHRIPHFSISIAYCRNGTPECGVVYEPVPQHWYTAVRGQGAWHNGEPARVSACRALDGSVVAVGFYYDRGAMMRATLTAIGDLFGQNIHGIRRFGTASLDLCMVGIGRFDAFFEYELAPWDFAAGALFVREAGGQVTTCDGAPLPLARSSLLASNSHLHTSVRGVVEPHLPGTLDPNRSIRP